MVADNSPEVELAIVLDGFREVLLKGRGPASCLYDFLRLPNAKLA